MWMVNPKLLCKKHLLGEHFELHKHRHNFIKRRSIAGRVAPVIQIEPAAMKERHEELVEEMINRGFNHKSLYDQPDLSYLPPEHQTAKVNLEVSLSDLCSRCKDCRERIYGQANQ